MRTLYVLLLVVNAVFMTMNASDDNAWVAVLCAIGMTSLAKDLMDGPHT